MIRNETAYREALRRLERDQEVITAQRGALRDRGLDEAIVDQAMQPLLSFHAQLREEVEWYERVKRHDFGVLRGLLGIGQLLIAARIANGMTQEELARRLGVDASLVSRDEKNEYHGITVERAQRIFDCLGESPVVTIEQRPVPMVGRDSEDRSLRLIGV